MPTIIRGPISWSESALKEALKDKLESNIGHCDAVCEDCKALHWPAERTKALQGTKTHKYGPCCQGRKVMLPEHYFPQKPVTDVIKWLLTSADADAAGARRRIRDYNNALSFTSMEAKGQDRDVTGPKGVFTFRLNGRLHHRLGSALPVNKNNPCFAQIYTVGDGGTQEAQMRQKHHRVKLNNELLLKLQAAINDSNAYAKLLKNANEILLNNPGSKLVIKCVKPGKRII
ncbi:uncharacterized protein MELLADRAFT_62572 [Melampsora larici-populina 98AG31]|uniref:Helitron helicase-like domain-containing protein n=1 Tax=Melampsora larici-populina (strain 98AG31 / pathotype 3-4-7) TaxID=747676 RepID=F4RJE9_MELLP|nr:uncharacterized protein MELLADRAFT_62572 [Melampsora larici-populina 98AG31]EGG07508.1 hypothetical protein MELLADRAFT_62572 [Melampsora larici-populina 98AG31]